MQNIRGRLTIIIETEEGTIECSGDWTGKELTNEIVKSILSKELSDYEFLPYDVSDILEIYVAFSAQNFDMVYRPQITDVWPSDLVNDDDGFKVTKKGGAKKRNG